MGKTYLCPNCGCLVKDDSKSKLLECKKCRFTFKRTGNLYKGKKQLKAQAWSKFSRYIRLRDCYNTTSTPEEGYCYTCGKKFPIEKLQAGHMVDSRNNAVLFNEKYVKAQCNACNIYKNGKQGVFTLNMIKELVDNGLSFEEAFSEVEAAFNVQSKELTNEDLVKIKKEYEIKTALLKIEKGNKND